MTDATADAPHGPDIDRMRAAVRAQLFRANKSLHDDDVVAGRYRLLERIGSGSSATVWRARDEHDDVIVALKLLRSRELFAGTGVERMLREAKLVGRLDHSGIVRVTDCGSHGDGEAFVAMELIEGRTLASELVERGPMPWPRARAVLLQVADALAAAHANGVVHRDLKPGNILLSGEGDAVRVKVIDFGLARPTGVDPSTGRLTGTGLVFGTPRYMSPEQVRAASIDARSDVYALGCVAYEMLTGTPAARSDTISDVLLEHLYRHPRPFQAVAPAVAIPDGVEAIVMRATRKNPELRFPDMAALRGAVLALDRDERIEVPTETLASPPQAPSAMANAVSWGRLALVLLGVGTVGLALAQVMS